MKAVLTSKGQITIPQRIRERLHLRPGDVLDFDESAPILQARRVVEPEEWERRLDEVRSAWKDPLVADGATQSSQEYLDETRGDVVLPPKGHE